MADMDEGSPSPGKRGHQPQALARRCANLRRPPRSSFAASPIFQEGR